MYVDHIYRYDVDYYIRIRNKCISSLKFQLCLNVNNIKLTVKFSPIIIFLTFSADYDTSVPSLLKKEHFVKQTTKVYESLSVKYYTYMESVYLYIHGEAYR